MGRPALRCQNPTSKDRSGARLCGPGINIIQSCLISAIRSGSVAVVLPPKELPFLCLQQEPCSGAKCHFRELELRRRCGPLKEARLTALKRQFTFDKVKSVVFPVPLRPTSPTLWLSGIVALAPKQGSTPRNMKYRNRQHGGWLIT